MPQWGHEANHCHCAHSTDCCYTTTTSASMCSCLLFRVWSLGETRLQLSVRNSRDEQQPPLPPPPPPPPVRDPLIRYLGQEVSLCVMCVVQDEDTSRNFRSFHSQTTMFGPCKANTCVLVFQQSVIRWLSWEYTQFPLGGFLCRGLWHTMNTEYSMTKRDSAFLNLGDSNFTGNKIGRKHTNIFPFEWETV